RSSSGTVPEHTSNIRFVAGVNFYKGSGTRPNGSRAVRQRVGSLPPHPNLAASFRAFSSRVNSLPSCKLASPPRCSESKPSVKHLGAVHCTPPSSRSFARLLSRRIQVDEIAAIEWALWSTFTHGH